MSVFAESDLHKVCRLFFFFYINFCTKNKVLNKA
jgi:hypothetical protein